MEFLVYSISNLGFQAENLKFEIVYANLTEANATERLVYALFIGAAFAQFRKRCDSEYGV